MFSKKDIKIFEKKIEELEDTADELTTEINKSYINEQKDIIRIIEKFIKDKKLIVYGGNAQNLAIKRINPKEVFYDDDDVHDYDIYSYDPVNHIMELTKKLYDFGYTNIIAVEAIHVETFSLKYFGKALCDMSYMPKYVFDNLPYYEVDNIRIVDPYFTYIDFMRMFNDPLTSSSFRWDKNFARFNMMQEFYPLKSKEYIHKDKNNLSDELIKYFDEKNKESKTLFYVGVRLFNEYAKISKCSKVSINYLTMISTDLRNDVKKILNELKRKYKNKITTDERYPFFQFWDHSIDIKLDNKIICRIFGNNNICIAYKELNNIKYTSFTYNLMWFMIEQFYHTIYNSDCSDRPLNYKQIDNYYNKLISGLLFMKEKYLKEKGKTFLDNSLFQHFIVDKCNGVPKNPGEIRKQLVDYIGFKYDPSNITSKKEEMYKEYKYTNISGRFINNDRNKLFK